MAPLTWRLTNTAKDLTQDAFGVVPSLFGPSHTVSDKMQTFFVDFQLLPLLVQDNYLNGAGGAIASISKAADAISAGDLLSMTN